MPRWSLALRPKYRDDEPTLGEGISGAVDLWLQEQEARRAERNQIAAAGGEKIAGPERDAVGRAVMGVGRKLGGFLDEHLVEPIGDRLRGRMGPRIRPRAIPMVDVTTSAPDTSILPAGRDPDGVWPAHLRPEQPTIPHDRTGGLTRTPDFNPHAARSRGRPSGVPEYAMPAGGVAGGAGGAGMAGGIGESLAYEIEGRDGSRYRVDPLRRRRAEIAMEYEVKAPYEQARREHELAKLGTEATYDAALEAFRQTGRMDLERARHENRMKLEDFRAASAMERARMLAEKRAEVAALDRAARASENPAEARWANFQLQRERMLLDSYEAEAALMDRITPMGEDRIVEEGDPAGKARLDAMERRRAEVGEKLRVQRERIADLRHPDEPGAGKPTLTQEQYDRARARGHSDAEIAKHYTIPPSVRRR